MREIDFVGELHKKSTRDYLARVNDQTYPKYKAAELAKKYDIDYWDGDRRICYGGYKYIEGWWEVAVRKMLKYYQLPKGGKILDVGCGKVYMLYEFKKIRPDLEVTGIDISKYAIKNGKEEIKNNLKVGNAKRLPWENNTFDLVYSINTLHCLDAEGLNESLREIERVGKRNKYVCIESWRNEEEKANLLYWQVTCESFHSTKVWKWWFKKTGYSGDYSFIYFE